MRRRNLAETLLALAIVASTMLSPLAVVAQTTPTQQTGAAAYDEYFMSPEHRQKIYEENRKKPATAVGYTLLLPGLGNIYAEQYLLAGVGFVLMVFAGTLVGYGLSTKQPKIIVIGAITAGSAYGVGATTSLIGVSDYNRKLRQGLKVEHSDVREVWTPTLVMRF